MPPVRNVRRSRRLSQKPPHDPEFEEFDDYDLRDLQRSYPDSAATPSSDSSSLPSPASAVPAELYLSPTPSSDDELPAFVPRSSHSRRQKPGHVPRPPNAFILYRSQLCAKAIQDTVNRDNCKISCIAAILWRELSAAERAPYERLAEREKERHARLHPDYKYSPVYRKKKAAAKKKAQRGNSDATAEHCKKVALLVQQGLEGDELERQLKALGDEDEKDVSSRRRRTSTGKRAPLKHSSKGSQRVKREDSEPERLEETVGQMVKSELSSPQFESPSVAPESDRSAENLHSNWMDTGNIRVEEDDVDKIEQNSVHSEGSAGSLSPVNGDAMLSDMSYFRSPSPLPASLPSPDTPEVSLIVADPDEQPEDLFSPFAPSQSSLGKSSSVMGDSFFINPEEGDLYHWLNFDIAA